MGQIDFDGSNSTVKADIIRGQTGTTVKLGGLLDTDGNYIQTEKGGDLTSASPLVIDTDGDYFDVTGTTNFAAMTVAADRQFTLQFDGALTMTHHATNLDLPGEANITTAAGDVATFQSTGSNTVQCISYVKADGTAVVAAAGGNKTIWLPAFAVDGTTSTTFDTVGFSCQFDDSATEYGANSWKLPDDFSSLTSINAVWASGGAGNARFVFNAAQAAEGENMGTDADTIAEASYATAGGRVLEFDDITATANGLTLNIGDIFSIKATRVGGSGSDTTGDSVKFMGFAIVYA